jgi:beta-glucosidase
MCSYNRINGSYACQNSKVLNGLLKGELGFQGYVMSDWGATHSGVASIENGLDMTMPGGFGLYGLKTGPYGNGSFFGSNATTAVANGTIPMWRLDDMIVRIMTPYYYLGQDAADYPTVDPSCGDLNTVSRPSCATLFGDT